MVQTCKKNASAIDFVTIIGSIRQLCEVEAHAEDTR